MAASDGTLGSHEGIDQATASEPRPVQRGLSVEHRTVGTFALPESAHDLVDALRLPARATEERHARPEHGGFHGGQRGKHHGFSTEAPRRLPHTERRPRKEGVGKRSERRAVAGADLHPRDGESRHLANGLPKLVVSSGNRRPLLRPRPLLPRWGRWHLAQTGQHHQFFFQRCVQVPPRSVCRCS